jgi:ATP-binding cassette subfamily B protein/ATP-binding cassette subfamily C protein
LEKPKKSKKYLYQPESNISGFDAAEIKGIKTETPMVSIIDKPMDNRKRTTRNIFRLRSRSSFNCLGMVFFMASIISATLGVMPKNILENFGFSLIVAVVCYILWRYNSVAMIIPIISMYALALYRILPAINRILSYSNYIAFQRQSLYVIYDDLNQATTQEGNQHIDFNESIRGNGIFFRYLKGEDVLRDVSFEIQKGERIAITGESGSGKTTLVDLMIGINHPSQGNIYVDGTMINSANIRSWRNKIGYIPQTIYLFDGTVAENVVFGSEYNETKIVQVLKQANIWGFLAEKDGINTLVGEGGIQLSGGQKQRIGIARALYGDPELLVLDEATSSLDNETEAKIMDEIYKLSGDKTLIVIAHRLSTVEHCNRRINIENGIVV